MDFLKTLLVYMVALLSASTTGDVPIAPLPPSALPTAYVTAAPTRAPTRVPTFAPTATPSPTPVAYTTLYLGDRGENVKRLQRRLTELGYLNDVIDGVFGQKTKRAVERFQYYNGLDNDGVAGQSTQYMLYESRSVVVAPPDITAAPSPAPTAAPQRQAYVPVYYVDQSGALLARTGVTLYASGAVYADSGMVSSSYTLTSAASVYVYLNSGYATPASVTFTYGRITTPAPTQAAPVYIPVYYMAEDNSILYVTTCSLARGATTTVYAQHSLVPARYTPVSASSVDVYVNEAGTPTPASVIFRYRDTTAYNPVPTATPAPLAYYVHYLTEFEELLYTDIVYLDCGRESTVYADSSLVPPGYLLISAPTVRVSVSADGNASPSMTRFTYRRLAAQTAEPTATPAPPVAYPVYYVTDMDEALYSDTVYLARGQETTVNADNALVPYGYVPISAQSVLVNVLDSGFAYPASVRFIYRSPVTAAPTAEPTPAPIAYNVYYMSEEDETLYTETVYLDCGRESTLYANDDLVPQEYTRVSDVSLQVTVTSFGLPTPTIARFVYRKASTPPVVDPPLVTNPPSAPAAPVGTLAAGGATVSLSGQTTETAWYVDGDGNAYIALERLNEIAGAIPVMNNGRIAWRVNGHTVSTYPAGESYYLAIDDADYSLDGFVMDDAMYLGAAALNVMGIDAQIEGDTLTLTIR